jgi:predicted DCC family thiol-disulfide oxidoreductase YuxK
MRKLDKLGAIEFIDATDERNACPLDRELVLARFHAREKGELLSGAAAFAAMWRHIPLLKPLGWMAKNKIILNVLEFTYTRFLKIRPVLQKIVPAVK